MNIKRNVLILGVALACVLGSVNAATREKLELLNPPPARAMSAEEADKFNRAMQAMLVDKADSARQLLTPLAREGVMEAQIALASLLARSPFDKDHRESLQWSYFAASRGDWRSQVEIARAYREGRFVDQDLYQARTWLDRAAPAGGEEVFQELDQLNTQARQAAQNAVSNSEYAKAEALLVPAAHGGDREAQEILAELYQRGFVGEQKDKARFWYEKAAENGSKKAQYSLAMSYLNNSNLSAEEQQKVVDLLRRAADPGLADAQYRLGVLYLTGTGVERDVEQAIRLYRLAAEQGNIDAQYSLGVRYVLGQGVDKDNYEAHRFFKQAANQGMPKAQHNLALTYLHGIGIEKQPDKAQEWFRRAALSGVDKSSAFIAQNETINATTAATKAEPIKVGNTKMVSGWDWFSGLPDNGFTIQVISSHEEKSVRAFMDENKLSKGKYLHYIRPDKKDEWHVVQYGFYKNRKQADAVAKKISANNRKFKPWVREIKTVRDGIGNS